MAYTKKKTSEDKPVSETVNTAETDEVSAVDTGVKGVVYQTRKTIPLDALVYVKNLTGGVLIYQDTRTGYTYTWQGYGEEIPIEMRELVNMKNTNRKFFTENWIEMDIAVLRDLRMDEFYKDYLSYDDIEKLLSKFSDDLVEKLRQASPVIRNSVGLRAMQLIDERKLTDINVIRNLEQALGCELIER